MKAPYEMADNVTVNALMEYGTVANVRRQHHTFDKELENGVRILLIRNVKEPIPRFLKKGSPQYSNKTQGPTEDVQNMSTARTLRRKLSND